VIAYGYNAMGQVASITVDGSTTILSGAERYPFGGVKKWSWGNGQVSERSFDLDGRVKSYTLGPSGGTYADLSQVFGYDSLNRLVSATLAAGQTQGFTYDSNSNRLTHTVNAATTSYTYPSTSHKLSSLSGATTRSFTYDNAGNITNSQGITYTYDGRGRMKQAGTVTYLVNGLGQRVRKYTGSDQYFAYDEAGRLIGEYDSTGAPIQETVWLGDLPVAVIKPATPTGFNVFYIWADHLGSPRLITDTANQSRWDWAHTDPFGNSAPNENPAGAGVFTYNLRFPGQYYDVETGKHYNYFRDYDPALGRYVQSDPIGLLGDLNTFAYVAANPLKHFDVWGLRCSLMGSFVIGSGTDLRWEEINDVIDTKKFPNFRWDKPDCSWTIFIPGRKPGKTPPCKPEVYWETWDLMQRGFRYFARDYDLVEHIYICDPKDCRDAGVERQYTREPRGGWRRTHDDWYLQWEKR